MSIAEFAAQATGIIGWLLLVYSYYKEDIDKLLFVQIISSLFYCLSYFLLGAYSGLIVCLFELLKGVGYYKTDKDDYIFFFTIFIYIGIAIFTYEGIFSLLPIIASIIDGFVLTKNKKIATIGGIISNALWVIYDIKILAYSCALTDGLLVISNISLLVRGYSLLLKTEKLRFVKINHLSRNIWNSINALDKENYGLDYTWDYEYEKSVFDKNKDSLILIEDGNKIVGYINYLVLNEEEFNKIKKSRKVVKNYKISNITTYKKSKKNYLVVESINIKNKFQNQRSHEIILRKIKRLILEKYKKGYAIAGVLATPINSFEKWCLESSGFEKIKEYNEKEALYLLDNQKIKERYLTKEYKNSVELKKYKLYVNDQITENMIQDILTLDKKFYKDDFTWDYDYQLKIFNKNKESMIIATYNDKVIGYLNYLVIKNDKHESIKESNTFIDSYELDEIETFKKRKNNYLTINSIVIESNFQNGHTIKMLTKKFRKSLINLDRQGYKIAGISAMAITDDGQKVLEQLGFSMHKKLKDKNHTYLLEGESLDEFLGR